MKKKKKKKLDGIVIGVLVYWIAFVTVAWVVFIIKDAIPDTLVQVGLGGGAVELAATAAIEILSNKKKPATFGTVQSGEMPETEYTMTVTEGNDGGNDIEDNSDCGVDI